MTDRHIAIIGGGASAALVLVHLAQLPDAGGWGVDVYDRGDRFGQGVAYSTDDPGHLLNVRAANMSAFEDRKDDFEIWARDFGYGPLDFVPRPLYALYLNRRVEDAMKKFASVQFLTTDVLESRKQPAGYYNLATAGGHKSYTDVVVATGNVRPLAPVTEENAQGYHADPWGVRYKSVPSDGTVILIGTGLSAVDAIQSLHRTGFKGNIIAVSRNGLFPAGHVAAEPYPDFFEKVLPPSQIMKLIRAHVRQSSGPWQAIIDSLRPHTNTIWHGWNEEQKDIFLRRALTLWNVHRHRMAPENNALIQNLMDHGHLKIIKDSVVKVTTSGEVICKRQTLQADVIINCMGYRYDEGRDLEGNYRIGPARFGELFETTAIPEIRAQANRLANDLAQ